MSAEPLGRLSGSLWRALFHPWTWRMAWRDSRTQRGRLIIFALSIVSGISALVAVHSLKASVQTGIGTQAKALLGCDLQISSRRAFSTADEAKLTARAQSVSRETSFSSMLYFPKADAARLVQVRGLAGDYPFYYGKVTTTPADAWTRLRTEPGIVLEPELLDQFGAKVGDEVKLGTIRLPILGVVNQAPPHNSQFGGFAPEAFVRLDDVARTGLLSQTSLALYHLNLKLPARSNAVTVKHQIEAEFPAATWRIETPEDRRKTLGNALDHFQEFLGLIALVALVLGAVGVAGAIHVHVSRRAPTVAILRCLGCPGDLAFAIYFAQALTLGAIGALLGAAVGIGLHLGVLTFFRASLPISLDPSPEWRSVLFTSAAGFSVCCGFALLPLLRVRRISPSAALRGGATSEEGIGLRYAWPVYGFLAGLFILLAVIDSSHWLRGLGMVVGLGVAVGALAGLARVLIWVSRRIVRPTWPYLLRQGVSNLHRPRNQTLLFLLSLGLGAFLILTILFARQLITSRLQLAQFRETPNIYLIDVQPDQLEGVSTLLRDLNLPVLESAPMVTMRIQSVRGVPVRELEKNKTVPKWVLQREFRSTYRDHLNATETLTAGRWFDRLPSPDAPAPLSLEVELARDLGVGIGDEMTLDVQGVPVRARVTSLRTVDWSRFNLNFFMVFTPGVLEAAPGFHVVTTRVPAGTSSGELQRKLVHGFPNVSAIDLTLILKTVQDIITKIARVVSILAGFTVLAGLPILIGTLLNGRGQRVRESILLRTLGASAKQIRTILIVEYATLGALSGLAGAILAVVANVALALLVFDASPWPDWRLLAATFAVTTSIAIAGGLAVSLGISRSPPLAILRESE